MLNMRESLMKWPWSLIFWTDFVIAPDNFTYSFFILNIIILRDLINQKKETQKTALSVQARWAVICCISCALLKANARITR